METKRAACGCSYTVAVDGAMEVEGIATDYAANHGDLSPGAMGATTDFYFGGNGTGILITSRPKCRNDAPIGWVDRIAARHVKDGLSQTMLLGEKHIAASELGEFPADSPGFDGDFLPASARLAGPGVPLARGPSDTGTVGVSFGSWHPGVCHFVFADGSVHALDVDTSTRVLAKLSHRSNGSAASVSSGP
jgi:prepilin-type processing-associated H-X9-DG protein